MPTGQAPRRDQLLDSIVLFLLTAILLFPLWRLNYLNKWTSIEATFIADGRMLRENRTHHLWQPLWYCGTRADYVYPPGLRLGVAFFYSLGIAAVYLFVRNGTGSRRAGWLAAGGVALISPCYLLVPELRSDTPWRLYVLMAFGEGPHISSLSMLPLAWLGAWKLFRGGGLRWLFFGAGAAALVVGINFYGATALAITFPLLVWSCWLDRRDWRIVRNALYLALLAYGLSAWWLVPSYLRITTRNLSLVSMPGNTWSLPVFGALLSAYLLGTLVLSRYARVGAYALFVWSALGFLAAFTLGYHWFGFQVAGNLLRLLPEFDVFTILCMVGIFEALWDRQPRRRWSQGIAAAILLLCCIPVLRYLRHPYIDFPADRNWPARLEYKTANWLQQHFPDQRVFVSGTIRFWQNVWSNVAQADGGSVQSILNPLIPTAQWRILHDQDPELARNWLQALGVDVVVVPGPRSQEPYKDFAKAGATYAAWPLVRDDGEGNRYYSTGRRAPGIVRIVDRSRIDSIPPMLRDDEQVQIRAYALAVESVPPGGDDRERVRYHWSGSDQWEIEAQLQPGESLLLQENYDPYWRAYVDGQPQKIRQDALGFMLLDLSAGQHTARVAFET